MNKVKRGLFGALITMLLLGGIETAFAWGPPWSRGALPPAYGIAPFYSGAVDLNLSEDQIKKLQNLQLEYRKEILKLRNLLQAKQLELQTLLASKQPDQDKVNSKLEEIGKLRTDIEKKLVSYQLQVRKVLTPEQWDKLHSYHWSRLLCFPRYFRGRGWKRSWWRTLP